jgi:transcription termination factor NusB
MVESLINYINNLAKLTEDEIKEIEPLFSLEKYKKTLSYLTKIKPAILLLLLPKAISEYI